MALSPEHNHPQLCFDVGLTCESCTAGTAHQLAAVCKGLRGEVIRQLFVQIHCHPACARMHSHFTASYLEEVTQAFLPMLAFSAAAWPLDRVPVFMAEPGPLFRRMGCAVDFKMKLVSGLAGELAKQHNDHA
jgi:hypothetical protein